MENSSDPSPESKWLRQKEMKITPLLPDGEDRVPDQRRGFKPHKKASKMRHASAAHGGKLCPSHLDMYNVRTTIVKTGTHQSIRAQTILSEEGPLQFRSGGKGNSRYPSEITVEKKKIKRVRKGKGNASPTDSGQDLSIEGNSVLSGDTTLITHILGQLTVYVKEERRLREELEKAKHAKLQAFRSITNAFRSYVQNPSIRSHPEAKTIARCFVVTKTLLTIIQTSLRCFQSKQYVHCLRKKLQQRDADKQKESGHTLLSAPSGMTAHSLCSDFDKANQSMEDILNEEEINKLKQLYFDYYECEVLSINSEEFSNAVDYEGENENIGSLESSKMNSTI